MADTKRRASCRELFTKFNILALASEFLLSTLSFVVDNFETFQTNSDIHNISIQDTDTTFMCHTPISVNIKKEFTILELSYSIIFPPL
jgi:cytochrome c oxidase subunit IV